MTKLTLLISLLAFIVGTQLQSCRTQPEKTNHDPNAVSITVGGKTFEFTNSDLQKEPTNRSQEDVKKASEYLLNVATAANIVGNIANELKDETKLLPAIWAVIPYLISDLPDAIKAGKALAKFQSFYIASGGLTADERAQVADYFAIQLALPFETAQIISEATIEAALANMKLVSVIQASVKK